MFPFEEMYSVPSLSLDCAVRVPWLLVASVSHCERKCRSVTFYDVYYNIQSIL